VVPSLAQVLPMSEAALSSVSSTSASSTSASSSTKLIPANAENRYTVTRADLPLSCPMPGMTLWNSHPKVYLPVEASGSAKGPYCGAQYTLAD
jgi:uncharacterized Zn-finger protein